MRTSFAVLAFSAVAVVSAQRKIFSAGDINIASVTVNQRANWCVAQRNTCGVLCQPNPTDNDCDSNTLQYSCLCTNGSAPGLEYYEQTIPSFICNKAFEDCIATNVGNKNGQDNCTTSIKSQCGTLVAQASSTSSSSPSASPSPTKAPNGSGNAGPNPPPSSSTSAALAAQTPNPARYGNAAAVAAIGLFAYLL